MTLKEQVAKRKAERLAAKQANDLRQKEAKARKKATKPRSGKTIRISMPMKQITISNLNKRQADAIKANAKRYADKSKLRDSFDKKIKNAKARGNKISKHDLNKLAQLRKAAKKEYSALHTKLYNLEEKAQQTSTFYNSKNKKLATIKTKMVSDENYVIQNRESGYVRIQLLVPMITFSGDSRGVGDYMTVMLEAFDGATVAQILDEELDPYVLNEDFVIRSISISVTTRF